MPDDIVADGNLKQGKDIDAPSVPSSAPAEENQEHSPLDRNWTEETKTKIKKKRWYSFLNLFGGDPPPLPNDREMGVMPDVYSNPLSKITFWWIGPLMMTGFKRPLQKQDLWYMDEKRTTKTLAQKLFDNFEKRRKQGKPSLTWALNDTFGFNFWLSGLFKVVSDTLQTTSPLVLQALINFGIASYASSQGVAGPGSPPPPPVWRGFVMTFGLFLMLLVSSICQHQYFQRSMSTGVLARTAIIANVYRKASIINGKSKASYSNGRITNLMSTDTTRIDFCAGYFHFVWSAPFQAIICFGLLINNLGLSSLAGFAFLIVMAPVQGLIMRTLARKRQRQAGITDKRVRLLNEILSGMRVIKFYAWETSFLKQLKDFRKKELSIVKSLLIIRAGINAVAQIIPVFGCIITFMVYSLNHSLNPATVFSSVALFNILRLPLMLLPLSISTISDAYVSLGRLEQFLVQDELDDLPPVNAKAKYSVRIENGEFMWEGADVDESAMEKPQKKGLVSRIFGLKRKVDPMIKGSQNENVTNSTIEETRQKRYTFERIRTLFTRRRISQTVEEAKQLSPDEKSPINGSEGTQSKEKNADDENQSSSFHIEDITMCIPRGKLVAIVGSVGSGKSSLLQALIGEMKKVHGEIEFGGTLSYSPQVAWIQNATVRDNILFGLEFNEEKYLKVIRWCCLEPDLELLPSGDLSEVGELGITLSGGQKQRINLARAVYQYSDIMLLDDPLSAVDAHVGKYLFEKCITGEAMKGKTRLLVTHQLHVLPHVDVIYSMENGRIVEVGSYDELMARDGAFATLITKYGGKEEEEKKVEHDDTVDGKARSSHFLEKTLIKHSNGQIGGKGADEKGLMQQEERETGSVAWSIYYRYIKFSGGLFVPFIVIFSIGMFIATNIGNNLWLSYWSQEKFNRSNTFYMVIYLAFGVAQGIFTFLGGFVISVCSARAAKKLHEFAMKRVFRAPISFFDTTPLGRIMNRFSKDVDTVDYLLSDSYRMFLVTFGMTVGIFALIISFFYWFALPMIFIIGLFYVASRFYRTTARELKRMDAILRSTVYAHFSESLSGLATIRAYRAVQRFIADNGQYLDTENRAYILTVTVQRWLGIRLDFAGNLMILIVGIFSVFDRFTVNPATTGLIMSYAMQTSGMLSWMVRQNAEVETNMNSVERLVYYGTSLEVEAPTQIPDKKPDKNWPNKGAIRIQNLELRYRKSLPLVLKKINLEINGGEKIGVVGRTGSGKSTLMLAIYRMVELSGGQITIDGIDISRIGLYDLRSKLAIIPQDPILFSGTIRSNLDPFNEHTDKELWESLRRAWLVEGDYQESEVQQRRLSSNVGRKLTLDTPVDDDGLNFSQGQKQSLALARALVKNAQVIILDEATSSVDFKTDSLIQQTIASEFKNSTLLTIAHRLKTIIMYDKVVVMDSGKVVEFDTPENLFANENSIFRGMCLKSGINEIPKK